MMNMMFIIVCYAEKYDSEYQTISSFEPGYGIFSSPFLELHAVSTSANTLKQSKRIDINQAAAACQC